jgi:tRNA(Leu) C34 or U34 (ribose-2'-O)-methylase TrmL
LYQYVFSPFWIPKLLLTDQHGAFNSELSEMICEFLGVDQDFALPQLDYSDNRHSQTMGAVERSNRTIEEMLRKYVDQVNQDDWSTYVFALAHAENKARSSTHKMQPDQLIFGKETDLDLMNEMKERIVKNPRLEADEVSMKINDAVKVANKILKEYRERMKLVHERKFAREKIKPYRVNEMVWLLRPNDSVTAKLSKSLASKSLGPFKIISIDQARNNLVIQINADLEQTIKMKYVRRCLAVESQPTATARAKSESFRLAPNPRTEVIIIFSPNIPEHQEKSKIVTAQELKSLDVKKAVGMRLEVKWGDEWFKGTIVGYSKNLQMSLIYYDIRTISVKNEAVEPTTDFYKINLLNETTYWRKLEKI